MIVEYCKRMSPENITKSTCRPLWQQHQPTMTSAARGVLRCFERHNKVSGPSVLKWKPTRKNPFEINF